MNSRRPHSPAVYRRRRLAAALLGVFVLALVVWGARGLMDYFSDDADPASAAEPEQQEQQDDDADPSASDPAEEDSQESDAAEPEPTASDPSTDDDAEGQQAEDSESEESEGTCAASDVDVRASTNQEAYDAGVAPLLILEIENTSGEDCTLDVGTAEQTFRVSHGGREIFNTDQCSTGGDSLEMAFEPGQTERAHLVWPRSDSAEDCSEPTQVTTGDYDLTVSVSGITSDPHTFHITGVAE